MNILDDIADGFKSAAGCVVESGAKVAKSIKHGAKKGYHAVTIRNAKDECEYRINHYLEKGRNDDLYHIEDDYKDCSSADKLKITTNLQKRVEKLDNQIKELKSDDKTTKFCLFGHRTTKMDKIKVAENQKALVSNVLEKLNSQKTLRLG